MYRKLSLLLMAALASVGASSLLRAEILPNGIQGRFVRIDNTGPTADGSWFHIGEVRALSIGTDRAFSGLGASASTIAGGGGHGGDGNLISGAINGGGGAWTRTDNPAGALIDLGSTQNLQSISVFQRADGCCQGRLSNFTTSLLVDNAGSPGATVFSTPHAGTVTPVNGSVQFTLGAGNTIKPGGDGVIGTETVGNNGRFVRIQNNGAANRYLHIGEIESFGAGVTPDGGGSISSNELAGSVHSIQGVGGHGGNGNLLNNAVDGGGGAWTRLGIENSATIDLGSTTNVETVRLWQRGDGCCQDRLNNVTATLLADDGSGNPGAVLASQVFAGQVPTSSFQSFTFADDFTLGGGDVLEIEIDLDAMSADLLSVGAGGLGDLTISPGATLELDISGSEMGQTFDVLEFGSLTGEFDNINISGVDSGMVDLGSLYTRGQVTVGAVPEPSTIAIWSLLSLVFGAYAYRRRRRIA